VTDLVEVPDELLLDGTVIELGGENRKSGSDQKEEA
jgi:hypothetical protein